MLCSKTIWRHSGRMLPTVMVAAIMLTTGCAERPAPVSSANDQQEQSPAAVAMNASGANAPAASLTSMAVGTWLGQAIMDETTLEQKLEQLPAAEQERVFVIAENFMSTVMAMDIRQDGSIESEIEMQPLGERPIRESTVGQWRATQVDNDQLAVELAELAADNSTVVTKRNFRFYPDRNAFVMSFPIPPELEGCEAVIIFERQSAVANVAQQVEKSQR